MCQVTGSGSHQTLITVAHQQHNFGHQTDCTFLACILSIAFVGKKVG